jgi:hypothetical protein
MFLIEPSSEHGRQIRYGDLSSRQKKPINGVWLTPPSALIPMFLDHESKISNPMSPTLFYNRLLHLGCSTNLFFSSLGFLFAELDRYFLFSILFNFFLSHFLLMMCLFLKIIFISFYFIVLIGK